MISIYLYIICYYHEGTKKKKYKFKLMKQATKFKNTSSTLEKQPFRAGDEGRQAYNSC